MLRAQCSLLFYDEKLYNDFVAPMKANKDLNTIIIKCLSAYYYNQEARNLIEGLDESDKLQETPNEQQEMINQIRQSLMMQSFMVQELQNTVDDGVEDVQDILQHTNKKAEETGVAFTETTQSGGNILRIGKIDTPTNVEATQGRTVTEQPVESEGLTEQEEFILTALEIAVDGNPEKMARFRALREQKLAKRAKKVEPVVENTVTETPTNEPEFTDIQEVKEVPKPVVEIEEPKVVEEDSTDLLNDLLSSLV